MFRMLRGAYMKRLIRTNALRKGVMGGHPMWRAVWFLMFARRAWGKVSKKGEAPIAFSEDMAEGEAWTIVHVPEKSRRGRGEGRRALIGPRRRRPRATSIVPPALADAGRRIVEAPDAARINQILGRDVVTDPPPTRRERKRLAKAARRERQAAASAS